MTALSFHDTLMTLAQVAIAFAGFTGIVIAIGGRGRGDWGAFDQGALVVMLLCSLGAGFLAFAPDLAQAAHLDDASASRVALAASALFQVGLGAWGFRRLRRDLARGVPNPLPRVGVSLNAATLLLAALQLGAAAFASGWVAFAFLLGLLWLLGAAAFAFTLLLTDAGRSDGGDVA